MSRAVFQKMIQATVIPVDGVLADPVPIFELAVSAYLDRDVTVPPLEPPLSMRKMAEACSLTKEEQKELRLCLENVEELWTTLPSLPEARNLPRASPLIFYVERFPTRERAMRSLYRRSPLYQTVEWLEKNCGVKNPIVWVVEE